MQRGARLFPGVGCHDGVAALAKSPDRSCLSWWRWRHGRQGERAQTSRAGPRGEQPGPDQERRAGRPGGSGKTTLVEMLLATAGAVPRTGSVDDGTTVSDHDPGEQRHGRSHALSVAPLGHQGVKVNLLDTPGYADFVGEVRHGLRAADCALFVVAATRGCRRRHPLAAPPAPGGPDGSLLPPPPRRGPAGPKGVLGPPPGRVRRPGEAPVRPGARRGPRSPG